MCYIGNRIEELYVEPLELPCRMPNQQPQVEDQPQPVRIPVPTVEPELVPSR
jgi:hypothetical protein